MIHALNVFRPREVGIHVDLVIRRVTMNGCRRGVFYLSPSLRPRKVIMNELRLNNRIISVWQTAGYFSPHPEP